uniref:Uncharacterized protein n=1 Tax=Mycolicibacterium sp. CBMA 213 TaxID=1968788 RepID=A0A343VQZ1_9MYCO|nr:hypothetical protein B5P44_p00020 [Mycolicibacterium sp. CBMA 213]
MRQRWGVEEWTLPVYGAQVNRGALNPSWGIAYRPNGGLAASDVIRAYSQVKHGG